MNISNSRFLKSASRMDQSPELDVPEIAIIGRSNVGKSTLINFLTNRKELAKASKVPGKTQLINFFLINETWMLVDFPGYGYAVKGTTTKLQWLDTMQEYLTEKKSLKNVLLLINGHLPPQKVDKLMIQALHQSDIPFSIIITKADKATSKELSSNIKALKAFLTQENIILPTILITSSNKKQGLN